MTLIPAAMYLLGDWAWKLPSWLDRLLPKVDIEGEGLVAARASSPEHRAAVPVDAPPAVDEDDEVGAGAHRA